MEKTRNQVKRFCSVLLIKRIFCVFALVMGTYVAAPDLFGLGPKTAMADTGSGQDSGSSTDGSGDDGSADDGSGDVGSGDAGSGDDGSVDDGSVDDGSVDDGSVDDGSTDGGAPEDDAMDEAADDDSADDGDETEVVGEADDVNAAETDENDEGRGRFGDGDDLNDLDEMLRPEGAGAVSHLGKAGASDGSSSIVAEAGQPGSGKRVERDDPHRFEVFSELSMLTPGEEDECVGRWGEQSAGALGQPTAAEEPKTQRALEDAMVLMPAPLPQYVAGTKYIYSNGTWERVVEAGPGWVTWVNHRGNPSTGMSDFTYGRSQWQTEMRHGLRSFNQTNYLFEKPTTSLWPLETGNKTRFDEEGVWYDKTGLDRHYDSFWRCDVDGAEQLQAAAGLFDTWKITCVRYANSFSFPKARARESRTWYYAPVVGHWVAEIQDNIGLKSNGRKELVAVLPDLAGLVANRQALQQIQVQFQEVLEYNRNGQTDIWLQADGGVSIAMSPSATIRRPGGTFCRQYSQQVRVGGRQDVFFGIACRSSDGLWRIPRR